MTTFRNVVERRLVNMRIRTPAELGLAIREQRRKQGLDQQTLAKRVGVSRQWLIEMEQGKARAELGLVMRTLAALGLDVQLGTRQEPAPSTMLDLDAVIDRARAPRTKSTKR